MEDPVLALTRRRDLYRLVQRMPGLHLRELERGSGLPLSTLRYHLDYLQQHGLVETHPDKYYVRYFVAAGVGSAERRALAALRQRALRRVMVEILARGGAATYGDLRSAIAIPRSTLALHLAELVERGLVRRVPVGRTSRYEVPDLEAMVRLLHTYKSSFMDNLVDHLLDAVYGEGQ